MTTATLDTVIAAETPEGITLELRPAGLPVRLCAFLIDFAIRAIMVRGLWGVFESLGDLGLGLFLVSACLLASARAVGASAASLVAET